MTFIANEIVYSRFFPGQRLTIVFCDGSVAVVNDGTRNGSFALPVGELTRRPA